MSIDEELKVHKEAADVLMMEITDIFNREGYSAVNLLWLKTSDLAWQFKQIWDKRMLKEKQG